MEVDVCVVGGGPAGSSAAIHLARQGFSVVLLDKHEFPRDKCCGDGLTSLALRELRRLGTLPEHLRSWHWTDHAALASASGRQLELDLRSCERSFCAVVRRIELDQHLAEQAISAGATAIWRSALLGLRCSSGRVELRTSGLSSSISARYVIAADGAYSTVRRLLTGERQPLPELHAMRQYRRPISTEASQSLQVWFMRDIRPGYVWSFPLADGWVNFGFVVQRNYFGPTKRMRKVWSEFRDTLGSSEENAGAEVRPLAWPIPGELELGRLTSERVLYVGDAAGAADPLTGEGIGQALLTGRLAARSISNSEQSSEAVEDMYRRLVERSLSLDHKLSNALVSALSHTQAVDRGLQLIDLLPGAERLFARWMFEDIPRSLLLSQCPLTARRPTLLHPTRNRES